MSRITQFLLAFLLAVSLSAQAQEPASAQDSTAKEALPNAEDPEIEQRMVRLAEDLRCLVCQNESLAGSHAELAEDLRREIRAQMKAGKNDKEVIAYLTERYGDFVLYRPPFKPVTYLLWLGPLLFLVIGGGAWIMTLRRRRAAAAIPPDESKLAAAAQLLEEDK
jgi:cytochrome c-type biogenesis protein CcmH